VLSTSATGGVSEDGLASNYHVSTAQADAYNTALDNVALATSTMSAQEYVDGQVQNADEALGVAVDQYVGAAYVLIEAVTVNQMAENAQTSGNPDDVVEIQNYINTNDVAIDNTEVLAYNDSLDAIEQAGQTFGAFVSMNTAENVQGLQDQADQLGYNFLNAQDATFNTVENKVQIAFANYSAGASIDFTLVNNRVTLPELLAAGEQDSFYTTGPTANPCFFSQSQEEFDQCIANQNGTP